VIETKYEEKDTGRRQEETRVSTGKEEIRDLKATIDGNRVVKGGKMLWGKSRKGGGYFKKSNTKQWKSYNEDW